MYDSLPRQNWMNYQYSTIKYAGHPETLYTEKVILLKTLLWKILKILQGK